MPQLLDPSTLDSLRQLQEATGRNILRRVFEAYLQATPVTLAALRAACADEDRKESANLAHSLKGSSGSAGAARVAALARDFELALQAGEVASQLSARIESLVATYEATASELRALCADAGEQPAVS